MAVRNFWIEGQVDGRSTKLTGGPRSKDGGFSLTVKMRDEGAITEPLFIMGHVDSDGVLALEVVTYGDGWDATGNVMRKETERW